MRQIKISILAIVVFTFLCGVLYPLLMTMVARAAFPVFSNGTIVIKDRGKAVGSVLIGQSFTQAGHFQGRPSATDPEYKASGSGASNAGPSNAKYLAQVRERVNRFREKYTLTADIMIPADLVSASASGLDPHISLKAALIQAPLIARERQIGIGEIEQIVRLHAEKPFLGFWGNERVNVLLLNMEIDLIGKGSHE